MTTIGAYTLRSEFSTAGGGRCRWAECERAGKRYFIKAFLAPKFPIDGSPGSEETKRRKRAACDVFEGRHQQLRRIIGERVAPGGNLVSTCDFFRIGTTYYKLTEWVDVSTTTPDKAALLPIDKRVEILTTLAHSVQLLHGIGIVHGDLKPANILVKSTEAGFLAAKLIDFDDSYEVSSPPLPDEIVGDQLYYSPELLRFVTSDPEDEVLVAKHRASLGLASDIFSLGLIFHEYLTGRLPYVTGGYVSEALCRGEKPRINSDIPLNIRQLVADMLELVTTSRPNIGQVFSRIRDSLRTPKALGPGLAEPSHGSRPKLTINMKKSGPIGGSSDASSGITAEPVAPILPPKAGEPADAEPAPRLTIRMGRKK